MSTAALENLKDLLHVGEQLLTPPLTYTLAFGAWDTGGHACLLGHYERQYHRGLVVGGVGWIGSACEHFGLDGTDTRALFCSMWGDAPDWPGDAAYAELRLRLVYLRELIAMRERAISQPAYDVEEFEELVCEAAA